MSMKISKQAVLIGTLVMLADLFWQILRFGSYGSSSRGSSENKDGGKGGGGIVMVVIFVIAVILAIFNGTT